MAIAYDTRLIDRIKPKINQWEATTGRRVTPQILEALLKSELDVESNKALQSKELELREKAINSDIDYRNKALALEEEQGKIAGIVDIAGAGATYSLAKSYLGGGPAVKGGQQAIAGAAATATGGQALVTGPATTVEALDAFYGYDAATTAATSTPAATGTAAPGLGIPLLAGTGGKLLAGAVGANQETSNVAGGAIAGGLAFGPVGAVFGGIIGLGLGEVADSVLCTHLYKTGQLDFEIYRHASFYALGQIPWKVYSGYRIMADPLVKRAKKSRFWNQIVRWIGIPMSKELAHKYRPKRFKANYSGKIILLLGMPLCKLVYRLTPGKKLVEMEVL